MSDSIRQDTVSRVVDAAKKSLPPEDAAKIERLARDRDAIKQLTAGMSDRDWSNVMKVINDPELLRRVMASPQGKNALHDFLKKIP